MGRVVRTCPGVDGHIRVVKEKNKGQTYLRPVARLMKLPAWEDDEDTKPSNVLLVSNLFLKCKFTT